MKKLVLILLIGFSIFRLGAAEAEWLTDLSKAMDRARDQKKLVLVDFNGSDWCPPCKELRKIVFSSPEFVDYAKTNLVLVDVDFPRHKAQTEETKKGNQQLAEKFGVEGFPTVIVLDANGKQLRKSVGYEGEGPKKYISQLEELRKKNGEL